MGMKGGVTRAGKVGGKEEPMTEKVEIE